MAQWRLQERVSAVGTGTAQSGAQSQCTRLQIAAHIAIVPIVTKPIIGWAITLRALHERVASYNVYAPMLIVVIFILIAVIALVLERRGSDKDDQTR